MSLTASRTRPQYKNKTNPTPSTHSNIKLPINITKTPLSILISRNQPNTRPPPLQPNMNPTLLALILAISAVSVSAAPIPLQDVVEGLVSPLYKQDAV
jgi:hypothetical protein